FWLLRRLRAPAWLAVGATIAALLFYLLLVGDRPPVERAFWMVAAYLVARLLYREVHLANPIALALLLVLWLNPSWSLQASTELTFGAVFLIAFLAVPWIQRTSEPYRQALGFLDAPERDDIRRPAHIAQFRHDLLATAELLSPLAFWTRQEQQALLRPLMVAVRASLRTYDFLVISFAIALGFVLLTAVHFNAVVATAVLANVAVVPLVAWIVPLGFAALFLALLAPPAAVPLGWAATLLVGLLLAVVGVLADFGTRLGVAYGVPPPPGWVALLYLAVLAWLAAVVQYRRRQRWPLLALAVLILVVASHPFAPKIKDDALEITVLDVGQGDAIFLAFPNGALWLIDAGRAPIEIEEGYRVGEAIGETVVTPYLRTRGLKRLDRVWLTHAHLDHLGGLEEVFEEFDVAQLDIGPGPTNQRLERLMDAARALGTRVETHTSGERLTEADVEVEILWPPAAREPAPTPSNNDSLVLRLCRRQTCALLPGDIEADVETTLAAQGAPLTAALLKVPHHGGRGSASKQFLQAVSPAVAVLSVGATNPFGHPYRDVLERLRAESERVYRTDRDGSVTVLIGDGIAVETFRQQKGGSHASLWSKLAALARRLWAG
ncbi:MAG: ComEC/Rec2 family competence protein, partial [Terriglobia bacterium]